MEIRMQCCGSKSKLNPFLETNLDPDPNRYSEYGSGTKKRLY